MLRVKEVIKEKGTTVKDIAGKLGISPPALSDAINGNPTVDNLVRIASALEVPITELFEKCNDSVFQCPKCGTALHVEIK